MRLTLTLPDPLHAWVLARGQVRGLSAQDVIRELLTEAQRAELPRPPMSRLARIRLMCGSLFGG